MALTARQVQEMLGIPDDFEFAFGYTLDRTTISLYFNSGDVVVSLSRMEGMPMERVVIAEHKYKVFTADILAGYKRMYRNLTNQRFVDLMESFGNDITLI